MKPSDSGPRGREGNTGERVRLSSRSRTIKVSRDPAAAFNVDLARVFTISALAQALWSIAGSSDVSKPSYVTLQPLLAVHLDGGIVISSDETMSFYWAGGSTTIPVNLGIGHAFSTHFVGTLKGALTVAGDDQGTFKAELELAFLP